MVYENIKAIIENKKVQVVEIREIENQVKDQSKLIKLTTFLGVPKVECVEDKGAGGGWGGAAGGGGGGGSIKPEPKIVHVDTVRESRQLADREHRTAMREARSEACNIL